MIIKVHKTQDGRKVIAICDSNLIGKKFEEKNLQLDLTSNFYKGEEKSEEEIIESIKGSYIINLVGKNSINLGIKLDIINKNNIIKIKNIPHAQAILEQIT
jgi:hypothetical protein